MVACVPTELGGLGVLSLHDLVLDGYRLPETAVLVDSQPWGAWNRVLHLESIVGMAASSPPPWAWPRPQETSPWSSSRPGRVPGRSLRSVHAAALAERGARLHRQVTLGLNPAVSG
jgi:hypothetical protein